MEIECIQNVCNEQKKDSYNIPDSQLSAAREYLLYGTNPKTLIHDFQQTKEALQLSKIALQPISNTTIHLQQGLVVVHKASLSSLKLLQATCTKIITSMRNLDPPHPPIQDIYFLFRSLSALTDYLCECLTNLSTRLRTAHNALESHLQILTTTRIPNLRAQRASSAITQSAVLEYLKVASERTSSLDRAARPPLLLVHELLAKSSVPVVSRWATARTTPAQTAQEEAQLLQETKQEQRKKYKQAVEDVEKCNKLLKSLEMRSDSIRNILPVLKQAETKLIGAAVALMHVAAFWDGLANGAERGDGHDVRTLLKVANVKSGDTIVPKTVTMVITRFLAHWQAFGMICHECKKSIESVEMEDADGKYGLVTENNTHRHSDEGKKKKSEDNAETDRNEGDTNTETIDGSSEATGTTSDVADSDTRKENNRDKITEIDEVTDLRTVLAQVAGVDVSDYGNDERMQDVRKAMRRLREYLRNTENTETS